MKNCFLFLLTIGSLNSFAQKATITYFDEAGNITGKENNPATFKSIAKENDSTYIVRYYRNYGPIIRQESYKDEKLTTRYGIFIWYNKDGDFDSSETYNINGEIISTSNNKKIQEPVLQNGDTMSFSPAKDTTISMTEKEDTIKYTISTNRAAGLSDGENEWIDYIRNNINPSVGKQIPKYKNLKDNKAVVVVSFLVLKDGSVGDIYVTHSSGYPFDKEAIRLIIHSPKWHPATINGKPVLFRQKQRIIFSK